MKKWRENKRKKERGEIRRGEQRKDDKRRGEERKRRRERGDVQSSLKRSLENQIDSHSKNQTLITS